MTTIRPYPWAQAFRRQRPGIERMRADYDQNCYASKPVDMEPGLERK